MSSSTRSRGAPRLVVAGAGAFGLACALSLARRGCEVMVCDPGRLGENASGVAAGMLAPAFEALLDPLSGDHFELFAFARALWPNLAAGMALPLDRDGALWAGQDAAGMEARLDALGAQARRLSAAEAMAAAPGLHLSGEAVYTPEDWRIDVAIALLALRTAAATAGARFVTETVVGFEAGKAMLADGRTLEADGLVLATGAARGDLAPELDRLTPVKGHILRLRGEPLAGPVVRAEGVYVRPHLGGAVVGATMEVGRSDLAVDEAIVQGLAAKATALFPALEGAPRQASVGVRATTVDGLPMVGPSESKGVLLAVGARRNGWLLAPMVGELVADYVFDRAPSRFAAALAPQRLNAR